MLRVGITGSIGSGKSAVGRILSEKGYPVLDADLLVHQLYASNSLLRESLSARFGKEILTPDGVDRSKLKTLVFQDDQARLDLEEMVYPVLEQEQNRILSEWEGSFAVAFVEAALLYRLPHFVDSLFAVWVVSSSEEVRLERLIQRGLSLMEAKSRIELQKTFPLPNHKHIFYIQNEGSLVELADEINKKLVFL
jgi:dephospho-CoA kinase